MQLCFYYNNTQKQLSVMYTKLLLMPTRYSAMCSIISFSICIFIRLLLIVISLSHIAKNLNAGETNTQQLNANEVESEIADNTEDLYEDSLNTNDTAFLDLSSTREDNLIVRRKRRRQAILEITSTTELSYVIEKYRCVAILYEDDSQVKCKICGSFYALKITPQSSNL